MARTVNQTKFQPDENRIVDVVCKKQMKFSEYKKKKTGIEAKGYTVQAYEIGFYADGLSEKAV